VGEKEEEEMNPKYIPTSQTGKKKGGKDKVTKLVIIIRG
jgi:hypothetical protein